MIRICDGAKEAFEISKINNDESAAADETVRAIIEDVKKRGDAALFDYCEKFDKVRLSSLAVSEEEIEDAVKAVGEYFLATLAMANENITDFHKRQKRENYVINEKEGVILGQRVIPIDAAGIYVPGGKASYPSSVLMNAVPAKVAGVKEIVMVSPPGRDGKIPAIILAAAHTAGVTKIFKTGGRRRLRRWLTERKPCPKSTRSQAPEIYT